VLPPDTSKYCLPSSSYVTGALDILPIFSCHKDVPSDGAQEAFAREI
jgi:hypothetical protein